MIMCCRQKNLPFIAVYLRPNDDFSERKLEVAICSVCGALIAELTQFNVKRGVYEVIRPKRKHVASFIKKMQNQYWRDVDPKIGTKGNMGFIYGVNREYKNGKIYQYAVDFNGEKKLVKVIDSKDNNQQ